MNTERTYRDAAGAWHFISPGLGSKLISKRYHTLIAGQTGSGKSVLLNQIIFSLLGQTNPAEDRLILIDPKRVELARYRALTRCERVATEPAEILRTFDDLIAAMDERYRAMQSQGLTEWNGARLWVIVDELADLMTTERKAALPKLQRLAQLGRAAGIVLIAATQAPSRKVIPAELTLNFPQKIALHCDSAIESRQVLNAPGAELLPRWGECLVRVPGEEIHRYAVEMIPAEDIAERITADASRMTRTAAPFRRSVGILRKISAILRA